MKNQRTILIILFTFLSISLYSQEFSVSGIVKSEKGEPISFVSVHQKDSRRHVYTDNKGEYSIKLFKGKTTLIFSCLGYETKEIEIDIVTDRRELIVTLQETSLSLDEVTIVAKSVENKSGTSVYEIGEQAIKQVQAMNLSDVLTLLPGKKIAPPQMNQVQQPDLRTAATSSANNFGTSIILDGAQISNDGNMQADNPASSISGNKTAVGMGIDLRTITTSSIEKVEVISGVSSPKYGDLTSGAIIVKSKVGKSPLIVSANLNPSSYQFSLGKGVELNNDKGFINTDLSYTYSNASPIDRKDYFNNVNLAVRWRRYVIKSLEWSNTISFGINTSNNGQRIDPDEIYKNKRTTNNQRFLTTISGNLKFLGTTSYNFSANIDNQYSKTESVKTDGPFPLIGGLEEGTFFTTYSPLVYEQETLIRGLPINLNGRLEVDQDYKFGYYLLSQNTGVQYSYTKNRGKGRVSSGDVIGLGGIADSRGAKFHEIPASTSLSAYHESNLRRVTDIARQELRLGLRYDFMNSKYHLASPRLSYSFLFKDFIKLRGSWGVSYKAPAMIQLYPGPSYHDFVNLSYYANDPNERLAIVTTHIEQPTNEHLRPSKGDTKEIGIDLERKNFNIRATYFHKTLSGGIYHTSELLVLDKQMYQIIEKPQGEQPIVAPIEGDVTKILRTKRVVSNSYTAITDGFEVVITPPRIERTNTSFNLSLSYMKTEENDFGYKLELPSSNIGDATAKYGVYENPIRTSFASSGNLTIVQHIPSLKLVFNLIVELNFLNYYKREGASLYPYAYYDGQGKLHELAVEDRNKPEFIALKLPETTYIDQGNAPFYTNYHLQVRKETAGGHSFSFFANNCFWYNPQYLRNDVRRTLNSTIAFGFGVSFRITN